MSNKARKLIEQARALSPEERTVRSGNLNVAHEKASALPRGVVRKARSSDARGIAAVHVSVSRETYADLIPAAVLARFSVERRTRQWRKTIEKPDRTGIAVFVAADATDNGILGFGCCGRQRSEMLAGQGFDGEFQAIYVLAAAQGRGLGRALMAAMARHLSRLAISGGACWVLRENERARRFYETLGGKIVSGQALGPGTSASLIEVAYGWRRLDSLLGNRPLYHKAAKVGSHDSPPV